MKFVIDRSKWRRGGDEGVTKRKGQRGLGKTVLLNKEGFMCCLGQMCNQLKVPKRRLLDAYAPKNLFLPKATFNRLVENGLLPKHGYLTTTLVNQAIGINDDEDLTELQAEKKLAELLHKHGHEVEFVGEYVVRGMSRHED